MTHDGVCSEWHSPFVTAHTKHAVHSNRFFCPELSTALGAIELQALEGELPFADGLEFIYF